MTIVNIFALEIIETKENELNVFVSLGSLPVFALEPDHHVPSAKEKILPTK
jgi:hypothetical protein